MRALLAFLFALLSCWAGAHPFDVFLSDDDAFAAIAAEASSVQGSVLDLGTRTYQLERVHTLSSPDGYFALRGRGSGFWRQITMGPNAGLVFVDLKDARLEDIGIRAYPEKGKVAIKFVSNGSSGRVHLEHVMVQNFETGMLWEGPNGADLSNWTVEECHATQCGTGFKIVGVNALSPWRFVGCTVQQSAVGWDTTQGGSGVWWTQCGGSDVGLVWNVSGGYLGGIERAETERCGVVLRIGDFDKDCGQPSPYDFHATDLRDGAVIEVFKAGKVSIDVKNAKGSALVVRAANKNAKVQLELSQPTLKGTVSVLSKEGVVKVDGAVAFPK